MLGILGWALLGDLPTTELVRTPAGFELRRNGRPYFIKGAGAPAKHLKDLRRAGANSVRTWGAGDDLGPYLDEAHRLGMSVTVGIWLNKVDDGGRYDDPTYLQQQAEMVRTAVRRYRNHPAVLMWSLGNELELGGGETVAVYRQIERLTQITKAEDPTRPVMTVTADMWPSKMKLLLEHCPSLDLLGVNSYGGLATLTERMKDWTKPYVVTEFAYVAPHDAPKTPWETPWEPNSTQKARELERNYRRHVLGHPGRVLGSYFFYWGTPDIGTTSWFSANLGSGERLELTETLTRLWRGRPASNRAPRVQSVEPSLIEETHAGSTVSVRLNLRDPDGDEVRVSYEVLPDDPKTRFVGDFEKRVATLATGSTSGTRMRVRVPNEVGAYRIQLVARDGRGAAAVAVVPVRVVPKK